MKKNPTSMFCRAALAVLLLGLLMGCSAQKPSCFDCNGKGLGEARPTSYAGFDRNQYPGDAALGELHERFAFTSYWLNNPPGASRNTWTGKREILRNHGFGFLVLVNGHVDDELVASAKKGVAAKDLGGKDAATAIAAAQREGFPKGTVLFLDQEEGGRLLPEAADYLFAWTEAVAHSAYHPGAYLSGIPSDDGKDASGNTLYITTAQDVQEQVARKHLAPVTLFVYQDSCPPSNGCTVKPPALSESGTPNASVWQYAQSPRRSAVTRACLKTYAADNNCYADAAQKVFVDLDVAASADPSHGR